MNIQPTPAQRLEILQMPYLKTKEVMVLVGRSKPTCLRTLKEAGICKTALGWLTDDIIKTFHLGGAIRRWKDQIK